MSRPSLLITRRLPAAVLERLRASYEVTVNPDDRPLSRDTLLSALRTYDALSPTITDKLDASLLLSEGLKVRILANFGAGFEHIDLAAAKSANVVVTNTPDALTDATAELTILLILMASRRAGEGERVLRNGKWTGWAPTQLLGMDVKGKTLGLVGFGRIAKEAARRARAALGMRIAYHSRSRASTEEESALEAEHHTTLDSLLAASDVVSLHCPGGAATRHLINSQTLAQMKSTAILINTARGSVVDEDALAMALAQRQIAAAGLDVYEREPAVSAALQELENAVLLPHLGSATLEARTAMGMQMADNLDHFFAGRTPPNRVA
ncbi:2-hydroxyacid dehydrogenase [Steroidobacter sp.]|uniref:2-hydroxyacid dehydrogenase n=1 Tax=Steroidobacter sp. TaxID=1978227 RepID=UPI0025DDCBA4|nr:D-glycerate dehydrogenase [Steroidobacter sp.]